MIVIKYFVAFLIIINIVIPIVFISVFTNTNNEEQTSIFEISLYIVELNETKKISFEDYIKQVVYAEMPASFELEALKAQAIAARSYTYKKLKSMSHAKADLCTDSKHCQAWKMADNSDAYKKISQAVDATKGKVVTYKGEIINAVYHASSGGFTEDAVNVWGGSEDYLVGVESANEERILDNYETIVNINKKDFLNKLGLTKLEEIKVISRTRGDRVKEISINDNIFTGNKLREIFGLRSTNFDVNCKENQIIFVVKGYGHGVGLSQYGAQVMALKGEKCEEILKHYYTGVEINLYQMGQG